MKIINRNINVNGRRTSIRLETEFWDALADIRKITGNSYADIFSVIEDDKPEGAKLTSSIRIFIMSWYREYARCL